MTKVFESVIVQNLGHDWLSVKLKVKVIASIRSPNCFPGILSESILSVEKERGSNTKHDWVILSLNTI